MNKAIDFLLWMAFNHTDTFKEYYQKYLLHLEYEQQQKEK